ncbi:carboxymuconolactone decarboxylase family protein [Kordiimonas lacus]|uniref:Uncharacterized peroxidase-related enzyme n=1 Tax=Kordiimonas lacus TaxID=637679 RepID=A0A1G6Y6L3_9PROT|nr:carboxymuconolactone decarboxylase family protein [Kordiimonas lacus]SDD86000.1 uncharacterized peroxidase-related enzyme [Kordiimonas lacus]
MFPTHSIDSAPAGSKETLAAIEKGYGFLPNLAGKLAEAPTALKGFVSLAGIFSGNDTTLSPLEQQIVLVATSAENGCDYCTAAHGMLAHKSGLGRDDVSAAQSGLPLSDPKQEALRAFTTIIVEKRGWAGEDEIQSFLDAGYTRAQVLEVVIGVAVKTITNYVNHMTKPELNVQFADYAVTRQAAE